MLLFGLVVVLIGALLPFLRDALDVALAQAGELFVWMNLSMLSAAYVLGCLMDRAGLKAPMALGPALVALAAAVYSAALTFPPPKQRARSVPGHVSKLLAERFLLVMGLLLFCPSGCEFGLGGFLSWFFTQAKELSPNAAPWLLALRLPVGLSALIAGTVALGLGVSGVYPTALGLAGAAYPQQSGTVFGILFTFGLTRWKGGALAGGRCRRGGRNRRGAAGSRRSLPAHRPSGHRSAAPAAVARLRENESMIRGIEHVAIASPNPAELAQWYVDKLGFVINYQSPTTVFVKAPDGAMIEITASEGERVEQTLKQPGLRHLAITVDEFETTYNELKAKGVAFLGEPSDKKGVKTVFFTDLEGNVLHLIQRETPLP